MGNIEQYPMSFMYFVFYFSVIFSLSTNFRMSTFGCLCVCIKFMYRKKYCDRFNIEKYNS